MFKKQLLFLEIHNEMLIDEIINNQDGASWEGDWPMLINC